MRSLKQPLGLLIFFLAWLTVLAVFWCVLDGDAMGFSLLTMWVLLPLTAFAAGWLEGQRPGLAKWLLVPVLGLMMPLFWWLTFGLANAMTFGHLNAPVWELSLNTAVPALLGLALGAACGKR